MKERLKKTFIKYGVILAIGLIYLAITLLTDFRIPCPVFALTGYSCPGCGITRMILAAVRLDFASAFYYNPFIFLTLPLILFILFVSEYRYVTLESYSLGKLKYLLYAELILAIVFGIVRNIRF